MEHKKASNRKKKNFEMVMHTKKKKATISEAAPCIDPRFNDEKYLASRRIGDYYYSIYVKQVKPELRDAMIFLNSAFHHRNFLHSEINGKAEAREHMKIATKRLLEYIDENIGALRLFFTNSHNYYPLTGLIMDEEMWREEFPIDLLWEILDKYDDQKLFALLIMHLHTKKTVSADLAKKLLADRDLLFLYLEGASYEDSVKVDLIELYDSTSLGGKERISLKEKLCKFILNYYNKYVELYGYMEKSIKKEAEVFAKEIKKNGELSRVTDHFLFRRMVMRGAKEKSICIEFTPFCKKNVEYYASNTGIVICVGNGILSMPGALSDFERVGEKLKLLSSEQLYKIMRSFFEKPATLAEISSEFGVTPDRAYRILSKLIEERYILRDEEEVYFANKTHFENVIRLIERFGGDD